MCHYHNNSPRSNLSSISIDLTIATITRELNILQLNIKNSEAIIDDPHELDHRLASLLNRALPCLSH
jgi:hypothetical protein